MTATRRIYLVTHGDARYLIDATSAAEAIQWAAKPKYQAVVATARDVAEMMEMDTKTKVEKANGAA